MSDDQNGASQTTISLGDILQAELRRQRGQPLTQADERALEAQRKWLLEQQRVDNQNEQ